MATVIGARGRKCRGRAGLILSFLVPLAAVMAPQSIEAQTCGLTAGGTLAGVVNSYYPGVGTPDAGDTTISVGTRRGAATNIAIGDVLLVIQMQDATISTSNSTNYGANAGTGRGVTALNSTGLYEYVVAASTVTGGVVTIIGNGTGDGLINDYRTGAYGTAGQRRFQVIRVPQYSSATLGSTLTSARWDGSTGGVLAIDVAGTLALGSTTVSLDGMGFRGAGGRALAGDGDPNDDDYRSLSTDNAHGHKGEGIAGTPRYVYDLGAGPAVVNTGVEGYPNGSMARGAPGNAGGGGTDPNPTANDENTGGGGGANAGDGGRGGNSWLSNQTTGGIGGDAMNVLTVDRQIMGGGGGSGSNNNGAACGLTFGGSGGGIVMIRAGALSGTGTITARGVTPPSVGHDGGGGAGGGGRIIVTAATGVMTGLTALVTGGVGGYANLTSPPAPAPGPACTQGTSHGPGGGGGGGAIFATSALNGASSVAGGASGLTNTTDTDHTTGTQVFGAVAGNAGFITTGTTQLIGVQICTVATKASVCGLRVDPSGLVEFATSSQRGTLGFQVYATEDPTGRLGRVLLTERPVVSLIPNSSTPILYRAETEPITAPYLVIEEIETGGQRRSIGPFKVGDERLRIRFERLEKWDSARVGSRRGAGRLVSERVRSGLSVRAARRPAVARRTPGEGVKIQVREAGPVHVLLSDLVPAGLPADLLDRPESLRVTSLGRPVPFRVSMDLGGARALDFIAEELSTDYSGRNAYVVSWGRTPPPAPVAPFTVSGFPRRGGFLRVEQNMFNAVFVAQGADPWIWDPIVSGTPGGPYPFDLPGLRPSAGAVRVHVGLIGGSDHVHNFQAFINGQSAGRLTLRGKKAALLVGSVPAGVLRVSGNELRIEYTAADSTEEDPGFALLDVLDLGLSLARPAAAVPIDEISAYDSTLPAGAGAKYLIVTHPAFAEQAQRIAALKEAEGYTTWVVDVENAYDRFSGGVMDPVAVQALIRRAARAGARYVLLIGDDTFDPRDYSGLGEVSYIPTLMGWDGDYGRVPSENRYADLNGDGLPEVAIGRLPVQTPEDAEVMVDKIARQAEVLRDAGVRHLFVVDNQTARDPSFSTEASRVASLLGAGADVTWADLAQGVDQARESVLDGLASGPVATHYFGHGSENFLADEDLIGVDEAASLSPDGRETLLFAWTCVSQNYLFGAGRSFSEAMLLAPRAGALASVGPTGITNARLQAYLFERLYPHVLAGLPLGEALRLAKIETLRARPDARPVIEGWSYLGDPALALPVGAPAR